MHFRVTYKKLHVATQQMALVEEVIEADFISVDEGVLLFGVHEEGTIKAIPAGTWGDVEAVTEEVVNTTPTSKFAI